MAKKFDWVFVPIVNVDGYEYSHKKVGSWIDAQDQAEFTFDVVFCLICFETVDFFLFKIVGSIVEEKS